MRYEGIPCTRGSRAFSTGLYKYVMECLRSLSSTSACAVSAWVLMLGSLSCTVSEIDVG